MVKEEDKKKTQYLLLLPVGPLRYPDRSAVQPPPPCQTANSGAGEQPFALFQESSLLGFVAPESVSNSTWRPLQISLSWPAGGRMERWGAEVGSGWRWQQVCLDR